MPPPRPIAIFSFDRPDYLEQVLQSLKAQTAPLAAERVFLFQDGRRDRHGRDIADQRKIEACIASFHAHFPGARAFVSPGNLGLALNVARAENYFFDELRAEAGYFFEDDLVLSPHYLTALDALADLALSNERIAYVAAYGSHRAPLRDQKLAPQKVVPMVHRWGYALTRRQWAAQRPLLAPYLELIAENRRRAIRAYFSKLGFSSAATTQAAAKDVASCVLGTAKVMSLACFGKYIGAIGEHGTPAFYEREGFGATELYPDAVASFVPPTEDELDQWIAEARAEGRMFLKHDRRDVLGRLYGALIRG